MYKLNTSKRNGIRKSLSVFTATCMMFSTVQTFFMTNTIAMADDSQTPYLISANRTVYASSTNGGNSTDKVVDNDTSSRWESEWGKDDEWLYVDLGASAKISDVKINWENAYAKNYTIDVSDDESSWKTIYTKTNSNGGNEDIPLTSTGRYVRLHLTKRAQTGYGYSIYEFQVYGTGGLNARPDAPLGPDIALNKNTVASSVHQDWYLKAGETDAKNAVDGSLNTRWGSAQDENQWIYVDLGATHTIGRVILDWDSFARIYDIEVSNDAKTWTKVYRTLNGRGGEENIPLYTTGRYVKVNGITRGTSGEFALKEFKVYDYVTGAAKPVYTIPDLPTSTVTKAGSGSYLTDPTIFPQPREPFEKTDDVESPIPSNDWWQSILIKNLGDPLITLPLKAKYQKEGLGILTPSAGWLQDRSVTTEKNIDMFLMANNIDSAKMNSKISGYGDYSASVVLSDNDTAKMKTTFVKGSPYFYSEFSDSNSAEIYSTVITKIFDDNGNSILAKDGDSITSDHIGIEITNSDGAPTPKTIKRYYGVFAPKGSTFKRVGAKIKMQLGDNQNYLSVATMTSAGDLNYYYKHGYAFVTDTKVSYNYDGNSSNVTTTFNDKIDLKRSDLEGTTLMGMLPAQWKVSSDTTTNLSFPSIRGTIKVHEGNSFDTVDKFNGIVPQFTEPLNSEYSRTELLKYLDNLDKQTANYMSGDPYWQGKTLHPLAMGLLIADQIGATDYKQKFISKLKSILTDWYTYTPGEKEGYYFDYNKEWGTLIYKNSEFGANVGITDHHFTYGYFTFASAVLATYDQDFLKNYGPMVDTLIRDYVNPSKEDSMFPQFRNFDPYEGHSWAGGYADNFDGNNQEAAGESLFGWVGEYLWGKVSGNTTYRNAGIYGFTTELRSVEQYWFNYDGDNWIPDYNHKTVGQVYGSANFYGTYFNGASVYVYGIHWLPTAEYLTNYGIQKDKAAALYDGMKKDIINDYNTSTDPNKGPAPDPNNPETDWKHITWPIESLSDPKAVLAKWDPSQLQSNEAFNAYWFVNNMATLGQRTNDIWAEDGEGASIYKNGNSYTAIVWNPSNDPVTVKFRNASGELGYTTVAPKALVSVDPLVNDSVSKTALKAEINYVTSLDANDYTSDSYKSVGEALAKANDVYNDPAATNEDINNAIKALQDSIPGLVKTTAVPKPNTNLALNQTAVSSSNEADGLGAQNTTDSSLDSRWGSNWAANKDNHPEYVYVDLGRPYFISDVKVTWSDAFAKNYQIQTAMTNPKDESSWTTIATVSNSALGLKDTAFNTTGARYVRIYCTQPVNQFGYSIRNIEVYGGTEKVALQSKINEASSLNSSDYTSDSFANLSTALDAAKKINDDASSSLDSISTALKNLTDAVNGLVKKPTSGTPTTPTNPSNPCTPETPRNPDDLAYKKPAVTSSNECDGLGAQNTTDSNLDSRWSSGWAANKDNHPEYVYVDLGQNYDIANVKILWDNAYAHGYDIQVASDNPTVEGSWKTVSTVTDGSGGTADIIFPSTSARYVRIYCKNPITQFGYSLRNIEVYSNKAALNSKISEAGNLKQSDYTADTWKAFSDSLNYAKNIVTSTPIDSQSIDTALSDLYGKIYGLLINNPDHNINLALNRPGDSSSNEAGGLDGQHVSDSDFDSRWSSNWAANKDNHPEYVSVDLGKVYKINNLKITWDNAYALDYEIQVCTGDPTVEKNWTKVSEVTNGQGGLENSTFNETLARYVRVYCKQASTPWGYSIKNIAIY